MNKTKTNNMTTLLKPRPYQQDCFDKVKEYYQSGGKAGLIVSAQGTGKRFMGVHLSTKFKRTLFIVHEENLLMQAVEDFEKFHPMQVGIVKAARNEMTTKIVVASIQTLIRRVEQFDSEEFDLVVIDETHLFMAKTWMKAVKFFTPKLLIGLTATACRADGLGMDNLYDKIVFEYSMEQAIKEGYLAQIDAIRIKTHVSLDSTHKAMGDFKIDELANAVDTPERNKLVVDSYVKYGLGRQGLAFACETQHAIHLNEAFLAQGIRSAIVVSNKDVTEDKQEVVASFKRRELDVLVNINILSTGFDYNNIGILMMARPTQSLALYLQQIGRCDRLKDAEYVAKHGQIGCVLDFVDLFSKHTLVNTWSLDSSKPIEERVFITDKKRKEQSDKIAEARKVYLQTAHKTDVRVNLFKLPEVKVSNSYKMQDPATESQIDFMKKLGVYDENNEYTKAMANQYISQCPASDWHLNKLASWKYDVSLGATLGQYQEAKNKYEKSKII
jgi:superfamily II DNA or RNA helicase